MTSSIKIFKVDKKILKILSLNEKKLLPILLQAAKKTDKIFLLQENDNYKGANFYPHDATKEEIEEAAKENSQILSPFTIVKRDTKGKLTAVDYQTEYAKLLAPIAQLFTKASEICENKSLKEYLKVLAKVLVNGNCQNADIAWLAVKDSNLDISIGCHERYLDKLFFIKRAFQANVGIIDKLQSEKVKIIRDILYNTISQKPQRIVPPSIVDIRTQHCLVFSGFLGRILFTQQYLPSDAETIEKFGSRIVGFLSAIDYKFERLIYPIFNAIFEKKFKASYSKELLKKGNYFYILLTAIAQQLHRYRGSRLRLKELFPVFDEANCIVCGIQHAKHLILKGVINQKELEAIMIAQICWTFSEWIISKRSNLREDYLKGDALTFNFLLGAGALQEDKGISWPNFAKMFFEIENLATIFTRFLEEGTHLEAQEFLSKYLSFEQFKLFDPRLSKIKPI